MKSIRLFLFVAILFLSVVSPFLSSKVASSGELVYVIPVEETVEKGLYEYLNRSIGTAEDAGAELIILELNTPGGAVDAASEIARRITSSSVPIVAFIKKQALSAGAYIALHADEIYMVPGSTMGSAAIIDQQGNTAGKKAESYWHAAMKSAAELNDRDPIYALAMADESVDLPELGAGKGKLLTLTADQAIKVNYAEGIVADRADLLQQLGYDQAIVKEVEISFAETLARFLTHPVVIPILLSLGSLGLIVELYSPGFGIPGIMGVTALLLFFYGHLVAGLAGMEAIILFVVGIVLILLEFFVPGGILGLIGFGAVITSLFIASDNVTYMAISMLIALSVSILASILLFKVFGKKIRLFQKIILKDSTNTESGYISSKSRTELLGKEGFSLTSLRPSGTAIINDERIDVITEGGYIERHKKIKVVKTEGVRVVVRELKDKGLLTKEEEKH